MKGKFKSVLKILPALLLIAFVGISVLVPIHQAQAAGEIIGWFTDKLVGSETLSKFVAGAVYFLASLALWFLNYFVYWAAWAVNVFLDPAIYTDVLNNPAINTGWTICRDFCNLFFVLLLLVIAFATIFRIQTYSAKALLPKFILAIFLINFSQVIATLVIDFGQILMFQFVDWMASGGSSFIGAGGGSGAMDCLTRVSHEFVEKYPVTLDFSLEKALGAFFAAAFTLVLALIYLILACFLLIRLIVLGLLIVLSPFAFMAVILPGTRSQSSKWWGSLFKYVLFGPKAPPLKKFLYIESGYNWDSMLFENISRLEIFS